jgi:DNA-binding transcriptional LysR family regulator
LGAGSVIAGELLSTVYPRFLDEAPNATLRIVSDVTERLVIQLLSGELDLIITVMESPTTERVAQEPLFDDAMVVACSPKHPLATKKNVTIDDVANERWALSVTNKASWTWMHQVFHVHGLPPPPVVMTGATSLRLPMVASSRLLGFCARRALKYSAAPFELVELRIRELEWIRHIGVSYKKDAYLSPAAIKLIHLLKAAAGKLTL